MQRGVGGPQLRARLAAAPSALAPAPCPACPVLAPSGGLRRGEQGGAHGQPPPLAGVRCRLPAPPAGPLAGRSWAVAAAPAAPLSGQRPHGGARPAIPPSAALGPFLGGGAPAAPPPARGGSRLFRAVPVCCLVLLPPALPPAALAPSPSRPPPPPGAGEAQEVDARCGGDGRRPPTPAHKKASPPVAPATCEKAQNTYFVQLYICQQNPPSLKGFLEKYNCRPPAGSAAHAGIHAQLRAGHKTRRFRQS